MQPPDVPKTFRFGDFELDVAGSRCVVAANRFDSSVARWTC